jgi:hypothetical protein
MNDYRDLERHEILSLLPSPKDRPNPQILPSAIPISD